MKLQFRAAFDFSLIVTDEAIATKKINHRIPLPEFGSGNFLRSLKAQILAHYPGAKVKPPAPTKRGLRLGAESWVKWTG
jgi:hypothetical protein